MHLSARSFLFCLLSSALLATSCSAGPPDRHSLVFGGLRRSYTLHVPETAPKDKPIPLVLAYHGSGGDGANMAALTQFDALADREGFAVAYPDAVSKNWNDGREVVSIFSQVSNVNDVGFTEAVIKDIERQRSIDPHRIYATGFSNGGIFVHLLASKLSDRLAAIAPVGGGIAEPVAPNFKPTSPLSVFIIHGMADPFVPYAGGDVDVSNNGRIIPTTQTIKLWTQRSTGTAKPQNGALPDKDPNDHCKVKWTRWAGAKSGPEVLLYSIEGGGHAWPGGPQFMPVSVIGNVCQDFDATAAIWDFFKKHPKP